MMMKIVKNKKMRVKTKFLVDAKIFTQEDVSSRMTIQVERYVKQRLIEANVAVEMANLLNELE